MSKKLLVSIVLIVSSIAAYSQNRVSGRVVEAQTSTPEPGAVVQLFAGTAANENMKGYALSDSLGNFSIPYRNIEPGTECTVLVVNMGRKSE